MPSEYELVPMSRTSRHRTRTALDGCSHGQGCTSSSTLTHITEDLQADISMRTRNWPARRRSMIPRRLRARVVPAVLLVRCRPVHSPGSASNAPGSSLSRPPSSVGAAHLELVLNSYSLLLGATCGGLFEHYVSTAAILGHPGQKLWYVAPVAHSSTQPQARADTTASQTVDFVSMYVCAFPSPETSC